MQLILSDNTIFEIQIKQSRTWDHLKRCLKHLQHVPIQYEPWNNPRLYFEKFSKQDRVSVIVNSATKLGLEINEDLCLASDQIYLNYLHEIFEKKYDGNREWLVFHKHLHMLEYSTKHPAPGKPVITITWLELAGMLDKPFDYSLLEESQTSVNKGDVYLRFPELGKTPYDYWRDKEPDNLQRLLEVTKPWKTLTPDLIIALDDINFMQDKQENEFNKWWDNYHSDFCTYYNIPTWTLKQQYSVIVFGNMLEIDKLIQETNKGAIPERISL